MRLWHQSLIPHLPRQQLLGQHRECCALRGLGWGRPHSTVNYVFDHPQEWLWVYHMKVMGEMVRRGYFPDDQWYSMGYRGKHLHTIVYYHPDLVPPEFSGEEWLRPTPSLQVLNLLNSEKPIYPEHNDLYLQECLDNLTSKGIEISL